MYVSELEGSPSLEVVNIVLQRLARGDKLISLAIGEPMYDTPREIIEVAYNEMLRGNTHYTSSFGTAEVRDAISRKVKSRNSINAGPENTLFITSKQAIHAAMMAVAGKRNEILLPDPGYFYSEPAYLAGLRPINYNLAPDNTLDVEKIENKITENTTALMINTPSNPTGRVLGREELQQVVELAEKHNFHIISDEAYEDLVYEKKHISTGSLEADPDRVISVFTLSKSYSMTGWRSGYTVGSKDIIGKMARVIEHTYTCSPPFIQKASAYALENGSSYIEKFRKEFREKRDFLLKRLNDIDALECGPMEGAFYAFPEYRKSVGSSDLAKGLLSKHDVAVLPGSAFGQKGENHIRISYSGTQESLKEGVDKLEDYLGTLT